MSPRRALRLLAVLAVLALPAAACGGDEGAAPPSEPAAAASDQPATVGSGAPAATAQAQRIEVDGSPALLWGEGDYGVVLAHGAAFDAASWEAQATEIAARGIVALAVEDLAPEQILAAVAYLEDEEGVEGVALVGGSAGADAILDAATQEPDRADQLILLSPNGVVDGLGEEPKLFVASEEESVADVSRELAASAPGDENEALILPGSAHAQNIFDSDQADALTMALFERLERFAAA
jgi:pimeloyl-ACP methyl ester carboxylesterase